MFIAFSISSIIPNQGSSWWQIYRLKFLLCCKNLQRSGILDLGFSPKNFRDKLPSFIYCRCTLQKKESLNWFGHYDYSPVEPWSVSPVTEASYCFLWPPERGPSKILSSLKKGKWHMPSLKGYNPIIHRQSLTAILKAITSFISLQLLMSILSNLLMAPLEEIIYSSAWLQLWKIYCVPWSTAGFFLNLYRSLN